MIEKARAAGLSPDVQSWAPYLLALARKGEVAAALAATAQMQAEGVKANAWVFSALVEASIQVRGQEGYLAGKGGMARNAEPGWGSRLRVAMALAHLKA